MAFHGWWLSRSWTVHSTERRPRGNAAWMDPKATSQRGESQSRGYMPSASVYITVLNDRGTEMETDEWLPGVT